MPPSLLEITGLGSHQGPMSIEEICAEAEKMAVYKPNIPLRFYLRSADAVNKQAQAYERDGNEEEAFKFFFRHAVLIHKNLVKHPEVKALQKQSQSGVRRTPEQQQNWSGYMKARQVAESNLDRMEYMKPNIKRRYEAYKEAIARRRAEEVELAKHAQHERDAAYKALVGGVDRMSLASSRSSYGYDRTQQLDPQISSDLAVKLAHNQFDGAGMGPPISPIQQRRRQSHNTPQQRTSPSRTFFRDDDSEDELTYQIMAVGQLREQALTKRNSLETRDPKNYTTSPSHQAPRYPTIPKRSEIPDSNWSPRFDLSHSSSPPTRPPKDHIPRSHFSDSPPPLPVKLRTPSPVEAPDTAVLDPRKYTFITTATTEEGRPLRTVFINPKLRSSFLTIALANTQRNLETCGILCGRLVSNAFLVSKLVIPEQEATSDTCDTVNEGALFDYCDSENLMTLGWIHTHPTQTCFMSSRDLHTHSGYQVQLAESIAIVCAPRHDPSWGVFRLTDPPGLGAILNCTQTGIFHPHREQYIYTDALTAGHAKAGHVKEVEGLPFDVVDLRPDSTWI